MAEDGEGSSQRLRSLKSRLIEILSADPDHVLQHADSLGLLTDQQYKQVKAVTDPSANIRDLLDNVTQKGDASSKIFLQLLKGNAMQETFPMLDCLCKLPETHNQSTAEKQRKREAAASEDVTPAKQASRGGPSLVEEKQLMKLARNIGTSWKEIGRLALDIGTVKLEQIEEDHPNSHRERVFAMLLCWRTSQRQEATAARLHALLCQDDWALPPDSIDFLLEPR
ncbi:FAS-associated death domain protein isoform X2 [Hypomesus transpacificus]|uniref:FAS-associated death domain protein isoform X2 n=1 Tax=Hypomesus transpacificus TaxID=137520 RepID=UPI001F080A73|nr:FAS-associated death domain protein isoform X2 [Hypomesus transpacificus]